MGVVLRYIECWLIDIGLTKDKAGEGKPADDVKELFISAR
jgi:hypothetical protein